MQRTRLRGRRALALASSLTLSLAALACNAIIGTRDLSYDPNATNGGGDGGPGNGADGSGNGADGSGPGQDGGGNTDGSAPTCNADLMTDLANCGACGHDCTGGTCAGGLCTLSAAQAGLDGIAVDGANVYAAAADGTLGRCATNGCKAGMTFVVNSQDIEPMRVRVIGGNVYFSSYYESATYPTGVYQAMLDGGALRLTPMGQGQTSEFNLGGSPATLFWGNDRQDSTQGFHSCPTGNCDAGTTTLLEGATTVYDSVFLPSGALVWSTDSGVHYCANPPSCASAVDGGGGGTVIYDGDKGNGGWVSALGYDASLDLLFFTTSHYLPTKYPDTLDSCPASAAACTPIKYAANLVTPRGVAAAGGTVYWTEAGSYTSSDGGPSMDGTVSKCVVSGGACAGGVKLVASGQMATNRVALDAKSVYWTDEGQRGSFGTTGAVMKAPR